MITLQPSDAKHKAVMYRLLINILADPELSSKLAFKGGTCASMLGYLDRFSVDLDFDLLDLGSKEKLRTKLLNIFPIIGLSVKNQSKNALQFFLKYESNSGDRNSLKLEITDLIYKENRYESKYFPDIDRYIQCQSRETMFANKLVAITDRYKLHGSIAARDLYDIYYFFSKGFSYNKNLIEERTGLTVLQYFQSLIEFINNKITLTTIDQDLNFLLTPEQFQGVRKTLKTEVILYLKEEVKRLSDKG